MQGFNMGRYVPPDLEGTVSFNAASGKGHALGARARKLKSEGVLVVRFECPFAIWCTNCQPEQIIGQGVRFNAEKKKVGNYYSTPIWSFKIKHTLCGKTIEVRTDPQNAEYVVVEGGRRRDTGADKVLDGEIKIGATEAEKERLEKDGGFGMLEKNLADKKEADTAKKRLYELSERSHRDWADPYEKSRRLRREFRVGRRQRQADEKSSEALQDKFGLGLEVVAPLQEDSERAAIINFGEDRALNPSSKPLFLTNTVARATKSSRSGGNNGKPTLNDSVTRRNLLHSNLRDNTRNVIDPFLSDDPSGESKSWQSQVKRPKLREASKTDEAERTPDVVDRPRGNGLVGYDSDSS